jgi:predicted permease
MGGGVTRRLADVAFTELSLQAIYAFRQGNPVPPNAGSDLVPRARRRVAQSKAMIALLLGFLTLGTAVLLRTTPAQQSVFVGYTLPTGLFDTAVLAALFGLDLGLLWWTGIQSLPTLLTSGVLDVLRPLPIPPKTLRRVAALIYLRLFDVPVATVAIGTPLAVGWALGPAAGVAAIPGVVSAIVFALALSLVTGRFFVRRVQGSGGGGGNVLVRWAYLALWVVPAFAILGFVTLAPLVFRELSLLAFGGAGGSGLTVVLLYPFPMAALPEIVRAGPSALGLGTGIAALFVGAAVAYAFLALAAAGWLLGAVGELGRLPPEQIRVSVLGRTRVAPQRPALAVLTKDLRIASRTPGYAFLILLPLLDSVALGLVGLVGPTGRAAAPGLAFGAVSSAAFLATFFGPAFFALEVLAHAYARTLPLAQRSVVLGKLALVVAVYLAASAIVLGITATRVAAPAVFVAFVLAGLPAVVAASLLELGILYRWARQRGQPVTNLYAGAFHILLVSVPGLLVVAAPLVAFELAGLEAMAVVGVATLAIGVPVGLARGER